MAVDKVVWWQQWKITYLYRRESVILPSLITNRLFFLADKKPVIQPDDLATVATYYARVCCMYFLSKCAHKLCTAMEKPFIAIYFGCVFPVTDSCFYFLQTLLSVSSTQNVSPTSSRNLVFPHNWVSGVSGCYYSVFYLNVKLQTSQSRAYRPTFDLHKVSFLQMGADRMCWVILKCPAHLKVYYQTSFWPMS